MRLVAEPRRMRIAPDECVLCCLGAANSSAQMTLVLGLQFPNAESGEATFVTPAYGDARIGSKLFRA